MNPLTRWLRRLTGAPSAAPALHAARITYSIDIQRSDRIFVTVTMRVQSFAPGLTRFRQMLPVDPPYTRVHSNPGAAHPFADDPADPTVEIVLPEPLAAPAAFDHVLTALRDVPLPDDSPRLHLRPPYPVAALGLTISFPLTRPPRDLAIRPDGDPDPDPTPLQATPRADQRACYVWLKDTPPPDTAFHLTWRW